VPNQGPEFADFGPVRISASEIAEMDGRRRLIRVSRKDVVALELAFTVGAERPVLTLILGFLLVALGFFPWVFLYFVLTRGGHVRTILFWLTPFGLLGGWLVWLASKRRQVLLVRMPNDTRRVLFPLTTTRAEAQRFLEVAAERFGYAFRVS